MEKQYALGLKSLPRATMTPSSIIFLARGCFSLRGGEESCQSPGGTFSGRMQEWREHACSRRGEKAPGLAGSVRRAFASPDILWICWLHLWDGGFAPRLPRLLASKFLSMLRSFLEQGASEVCVLATCTLKAPCQGKKGLHLSM